MDNNTYTLREIICAADAVQNRDSPPKTKKGKALYDGLSPYVWKKDDARIENASIFVVKFYDKDGEVITIRQNTLGAWDDGTFELEFEKDQARRYPPVDAVMCRIFASYDGQTLDPAPVSEFPIHELDLSTPDFHVYSETEENE